LYRVRSVACDVGEAQSEDCGSDACRSHQIEPRQYHMLFQSSQLGSGCFEFILGFPLPISKRMHLQQGELRYKTLKN
jgi:hypothetical protein